MKCATIAAVAAVLLQIAAAQNISIDLQYPPHSVAGCRVFDLFAIGNYSGPLLCSTPGQQSVPNAPPCVNITGKVILVTGSSTGIGNATAYRLSQAGGTVIGTSRYPWLYPEQRPFPLFQLDQTSDDSVRQLADRVTREYGRIDGLHLNAGRQFVGDLADSNFRQMELTIQTNYFGALRVLQAMLPLFPKTGYARILMTSSVESQYGNENYTPYTASKWALQSLQDSFFTSYLNRTNIQYAALLPGSVNTQLGYKAIYGCPELYEDASSHQQVLQDYRSDLGLEPENLGEAAYRIFVNPQPKARYLCISDTQFPILIPIFCRHYTLPAEEWWTWGPDLEPYFNRTFKGNAKFNCSAHYQGKQFGGVGSMSGGVNGSGTIGSY